MEKDTALRLMCWRKKSEPFSKRPILCNQPHFVESGVFFRGETTNNRDYQLIIGIFSLLW